MTDAELQAVRLRFARADLRFARKQGEHAVTGTTHGVLSVSHSGGIYTLTTQGIDSRVIAQGKPAVVLLVLAAAYTVTVES